MSNDTLKNKTLEILLSDLNNSIISYNELLYKHSVSPLEKSDVIKKSRRDIARIKTEIRKRELSNIGNNLDRSKILSRRKREK